MSLLSETGPPVVHRSALLDHFSAVMYSLSFCPNTRNNLNIFLPFFRNFLNSVGTVKLAFLPLLPFPKAIAGNYTLQ